jgi:tetratricopeptide (TPR) repeat protein
VTEPRDSNVLFISHNAVDLPYAKALESLVTELVGNPEFINVRYSTSPHGGPEGGEQWRNWIYTQVVEAHTTLIVVTPHALGKPWLLWEAGAVKGAALARGARAAAENDPNTDTPLNGSGGDAMIVSLTYGLSNSECPEPLRGEQVIQGADVERLERLLDRILQAHRVEGQALIKAGRRMEQAFKHYLAEIHSALKRAPSLVNEANVQDWLARLDALTRDKRLSEVGGFERWMMLAFGREVNEDPRTGGIPIDVRLHRRIGELYLGQQQYSHAVRQLRLAWRAAPRDIFVLRPLAEASMKSLLAAGADAADADKRADIKMLLDAISELDERAYTASPEAAGLLAKYYRRVEGDPERALKVYKVAFEANPGSYYLVDLVAQTELELEQRDAAQTSFRRALEIIDRLDETSRSVWSHATAATACVGLSDPDGARQHLIEIRKAGPLSQTQVDSIGLGIREVGARTGLADNVVNELLQALQAKGGAAS